MRYYSRHSLGSTEVLPLRSHSAYSYLKCIIHEARSTYPAITVTAETNAPIVKTDDVTRCVLLKQNECNVAII